MKLSMLLYDALVPPEDEPGRTNMYYWGKRDSDGKTKAERILGKQMCDYVNAPYRAEGRGGNYFFWFNVTGLLVDIHIEPVA